MGQNNSVLNLRYSRVLPVNNIKIFVLNQTNWLFSGRDLGTLVTDVTGIKFPIQISRPRITFNQYFSALDLRNAGFLSQL